LRKYNEKRGGDIDRAIALEEEKERKPFEVGGRRKKRGKEGGGTQLPNVYGSRKRKNYKRSPERKKRGHGSSPPTTEKGKREKKARFSRGFYSKGTTDQLSKYRTRNEWLMGEKKKGKGGKARHFNSKRGGGKKVCVSFSRRRAPREKKKTSYDERER